MKMGMTKQILCTGILSMLLSALTLGCTKAENHTGLYQEVKSIDKMVFATMSITKTAKLENSDWYKIGKRIAVYSYDSYMKAYIDMSDFRLEDMVFDDEAKTVSVTLPPVQTEVAGRDMVMRKEYENIGIMRSELDSKERA